MEMHRLTTREELDVLETEPLAVVYVTVNWSGPERASRFVFQEFASRFGEGQPEIGASFRVLGEECPGFADWFAAHRIDGFQREGSGGVVWLALGRVVHLEHHAAYVGIKGLREATLHVWSEVAGTNRQRKGPLWRLSHWLRSILTSAR